MRCNTNINVKPIKSFSFSDFRGVDYSSTPLEIKVYRSPKMKNLINDGKYNHKRLGWETFKDNMYYCQSFKNNVTNETFYITIRYESSSYYCRIYDKNWNIKASKIIVLQSGDVLDVTKIRTFKKENQVYMFTGYDSFLMECPKGETGTDRTTYTIDSLYKYAYIPTTSLNNTSFEELNVLTALRYNKFQYSSGKTKTELDGNDAFLDTNPQLLNASDVVINNSLRAKVTMYKSVNNHQVEYNLYFLSKRLNTTTKKGFYLVQTTENNYKNDFQNGNQTYLSVEPTDTIMSYITEEVIGGVTYEYDRYSEWKFDLTGLQVGGTSITDDFKITDIEIEFTPQNRPTYLDNQKEGILFSGILTEFGENSNIRRLFVAYKNIMFYSEMDDYTYYPISNYTEIGTNTTYIKGFQRLTDNCLAVYKERLNAEPTIYYITPSVTSKTYEVDGVDYYRADFPYVTGTNGETIINQDSIANFVNDPIILTENGIFAVNIGDNTTIERYVRERSSLINPYLKGKLTNGSIITYNNRLYVALSNGEVMVADARFKFQESNLNPEQVFEYEWWHWYNIDVKKWVVLEDRLCFISSSAEVCQFKELYDFKDTRNVWFKDNGAYAKCNQGHFYCNSSYGNVGGYTIKINHDGQVYERVLGLTTRLDGDNVPYYEFDNRGISTFGQVDIYQAYKDFPIESYFYTSVTDCGASNIFKTLTAMTITPESSIRANCDIGYQTRGHVNVESTAFGGNTGYDFGLYDYTMYSYESNFYEAYRKRLKERNFDYIQFKVISDGLGDSAITNITIEYKVNNNIRGVK